MLCLKILLGDLVLVMHVWNQRVDCSFVNEYVMLNKSYWFD